MRLSPNYRGLHPVCAASEASRLFLTGAATPPLRGFSGPSFFAGHGGDRFCKLADVRVGEQRIDDKIIARVQGMIDENPGLSRVALSRRICEQLKWRSRNGRL